MEKSTSSTACAVLEDPSLVKDWRYEEWGAVNVADFKEVFDRYAYVALLFNKHSRFKDVDLTDAYFEDEGVASLQVFCSAVVNDYRMRLCEEQAEEYGEDFPCITPEDLEYLAHRDDDRLLLGKTLLFKIAQYLERYSQDGTLFEFPDMDPDPYACNR